MAFISDSTLKTSLAAVLQKASGDLVSGWDTIITTANLAGYGDIVSALAGRGFTPAQIAAWDQGVAYNTHQGLFWALVEGAALLTQPVDDKLLARLDRRAELLTVQVTIGEEIIDPENLADAVGQGDLLTDTDLFVPDALDPRRGEKTVW